MSLRPYQQECLDIILERRSAGVQRQLVAMATGTGKSLLFGSLPRHMPVGKRALMVVHTRELVHQGAEHLRRWNPDLRVGIEMAGESTNDEQIIVASVQTIGRSLSKRIGKFLPDDFHWVIVDEAHRSISPTYQNVFDHFGMFENVDGPALVGLTATPRRSDGAAMGRVYDEIVYSYNILDAINHGWLSNVHGIKLRTPEDLTRVSTKAGDFDQRELAAAVNTPERNATIVRAWIEVAWPRKTIIFTADIAHAKDIVRGFNSSGIPAEAIWGSDLDRDSKLRRHRNGELTVLACAQLLVEGYDDPSVECVVMARPTKSQTFFIQAVGRGTRLGVGIGNLKEWREKGLLTDDDKQDCILIDCVGVTGRHSLVTLASLFGLNSELDMHGASITDAVASVKKAQDENPNADLSKLTDLHDLTSLMERVDLWEIKFAAETQEFTELQWSKRGDDSYALRLPKNEFFKVTEDATGHFNVTGEMGDKNYDIKKVASLEAAVKQVEGVITQENPDILKLLGREQAWRKRALKDTQIAILERLRVPPSTYVMWNRGRAADFITSRFNRN